MILTCSECETKFLIKAEDLGTKGRRVRCGNCAAVWYVKPPEAEVAAVEKAVIKEQQENLKEVVKKQAAGEVPSLPAVYEPVAAPKWLKAAVVILALANLVAAIYFNKSMIGQTGFYDMVGQYNTEGVAITDVEILPGIEKKGVRNYFAKWAAVNNSKESRDLPTRRIKILDKDFGVINKGSDKTDIVLKAGETKEFEPNKIPVDKTAKYVLLEIGNSYELMRR